MNKLKLKTSKFHIWVSSGNQFRDSVTWPERKIDCNILTQFIKFKYGKS